MNGRTEARVAAAVDTVRKANPRAEVTGVASDLSTAAGCDALVRSAGELDILVNNVGIFEPKPFEEIADADWLGFFETNVLSGVRLARHYLPRMRAPVREAGRSGRVCLQPTRLGDERGGFARRRRRRAFHRVRGRSR